MKTFRVGEWTVEPDLGRVSRASEQVNLQPQVMQLLVFLANHANEVISIDRMIEQVWRGRPMTSGSVYNSLNSLRTAFGDDRQNPSYIETIPKMGYRLIAPVDFEMAGSKSTVANAPATMAGESAEASDQRYSLIQELSRRNVFKVGIAYLMMAWLLIQVVDVVFPRIGLSDQAVTLVIALLGIGLFPAVFLAWAYELTPDGLKPERPTGTVETEGRYASKVLNRTIAGLFALAVGYIAWDTYLAPPDHVLSELPPGLASDNNGEPQSQNSLSGADAASIAVLPFVDMSPEADQQYFADGVAEEILNVIAASPDLKVVGRTSSFQFRDGDTGLPEIGQLLNVAHILEGSVRRDGDRLRVTAQLIKAADGYHIWSETYDVELGSIFDIQDDIAGRIAHSLQATLLPVAQTSADGSKGTRDDLEVYDLLLLARYRLHRGGEEDVLEAITYLKQALELDPEYARAHAELAWAYRELAAYPSGRGLRINSLDGPALSHANQAVALDPTLADAHAAIGTANYVAAWRGVGLPGTADQAGKSFARAFELNPNSSRALTWYSGLKRFRGDAYMETVEMAQRALELEPMWVFAASHFIQLVADVPAFRAEKWSIVRKATSADSNWPIEYADFEGDMLLKEGRLAETVSLLKSRQPFDKGEWAASMAYFLAYIYLGEFEWDYSQVQPYMFWQYWALLPEGMDLPFSECPFPPEAMKLTDPLSSCGYVHLVKGEYDEARQLLEHLPDEPDNIDTQFRHSYFEKTGIGITLATLYKLNNEPDNAAIFLDLTEKLLIAVSENYQLEAVWVARTRAYLHALRGEDEQAVEQLASAIDMGERDFRIFMHPAFNELHDNPSYVALLEHWMGLINEERLKLGLVPRELNFQAGPGVIPFNLGFLSVSNAESTGE